jgi:hypothetical protein
LLYNSCVFVTLPKLNEPYFVRRLNRHNMDSHHKPRVTYHLVSEKHGGGSSQDRYVQYQLQESQITHSSAQNHPTQHQPTRHQCVPHEASSQRFDSFLSAHQLETTGEPEGHGAGNQQVKGLTERLWDWMWGKAEEEAATKIEDGEKKVEVPSLMLNGEPLELEW